MSKKKIITALILVSLTMIVINNNSVSTSNSLKYLGNKTYSNAELTTIVNEMRAKVNQLKAEKADQDDLETAQTLATDVQTMVDNIASQASYDATVSTATEASNKAAEVKDRADDMQTKLDEISTKAGQINDAVNSAATPANVETVATVANQAKTDASTANTDVSAANDIISAATSAVADKTTLSAALNAVYPVGSVYMSVSSTSPATLFGGTWERLYDRTLVGAGNWYSFGYETGSNYLNISHSHSPGSLSAAIGSGRDYDSGRADTFSFIANNSTVGSPTYVLTFFDYWAADSRKKEFAHFTRIVGETSSNGPTSLDVRQPFIAVYMWRRTA